MRKLRWLRFLLLVAILAATVPVAAKAPDQDDGTAEIAGLPSDGWYLVQFEAPPLVEYASSLGQMSMMTVGGKLSVRTAASRAYISELQAQQARFASNLSKVVPGAQVGRGYQIVLNALAVKLVDSSVESLKALMAMPGVVRVSPQTIYTVAMDHSLPLIDAPALWSALGGRDSAGEGVKVAIVDTGIDPDHIMFGGAGFDYPETGTWPKGYCVEDPSFCNGKIIAARYYTPTFTVHEDETLSPLDLNGHGTHVAGTAAGNRVTASYGTETPEISGVAPGAWLMVYKGLFQTPAATGSGSNIMLAGAVEDAVADGADVINNSWGSDALVIPSTDPLVQAYEAAVDAGIVVVFSNGNSGPGYNTTGSPVSEKFIKVGASTSDRAFYNTISVTAPEPVTTTLQSFPGNQFADIAPTAFPTTTVGPLPYIPCNLLGFPDTTLAGVTTGITQTKPYADGWIALIPRGTYNFADKLDNAIAQGASAVIMYTDSSRTWKGGFTATDRDIYTVMISYSLGIEMRAWWATNTNAARVQIGYPASAWEVEQPNVIADFSSRGPDGTLAIKPDVVAPGVNILSAQPNGLYAPYQGTSMAAPHVTGSAALVLAAHPDWTPAQVRSALMSTADQVITDVGGVTMADIMTQGAGLIDLGLAADPGLTFDMPSHSFGAVDVGEDKSVVITAQDVSGVAETYALAVDEWVSAPGVSVTVTPLNLDIAAGMSGVFTVTVDVAPGADLGDLEGNIVVSGTTHLAHIPYWVRVTPETTAEVLLVDMDMSSLAPYWTGNPYGLTYPDYSGYYTETLANLAVTYDIIDAAWYDITRDILDEYDKVVVFTGDHFGIIPLNLGTGWGLYSLDLSPYEDDIRMYLSMGGKMLITGQDALGNDGLNTWYFMRGAANATLNDGAYPTAVGMGSDNPFLDGMVFDAQPGVGDGAGNQYYVDELAWLSYSDLDSGPLFEIPNTAPAVADGVIGVKSAWEPSIERVKNPVQFDVYPWRVAFLGFGIEGVNNDTGSNTREELVAALFDWFDDQVTVAFDQPSYAAPKPLANVAFSATMSASIGTDAIYYAWDFGDGSDIAYTTTPYVEHQYFKEGFYTAYVEVMDEYTHKAVGAAVTVEVGYHCYLPVVAR